MRASSTRECTSSFKKNTLWRWYSTVFGLRKSCAAMSRLLPPSRKLRDPTLLRCQLVEGAWVSLARRLAGSVQFVARP